MKIVIDIPEDEVNECKMQVDMIKQEGFLIESLNTALKIHVANGIPLPKGHGRLIDADSFIAMLKDETERQRYKELLIDDCLTVDDVIEAIIESLQNEGLAEGDAPTIIEAEREEEE